MKRPPPYIETRFEVAGEELEPDELTNLVGIQATASAAKPNRFWRMEVVRDSYSTDEGIQEILDLIWGRREALRDYIRARPSVKSHFILVVKIIYYRPVYELSVDTLRKLAYLECDFQIENVYDLRSTNVYDLDEYEQGR